MTRLEVDSSALMRYLSASSVNKSHTRASDSSIQPLTHFEMNSLVSLYGKRCEQPGIIYIRNPTAIQRVIHMPHARTHALSASLSSRQASAAPASAAPANHLRLGADPRAPCRQSKYVPTIHPDLNGPVPLKRDTSHSRTGINALFACSISLPALPSQPTSSPVRSRRLPAPHLFVK